VAEIYAQVEKDLLEAERLLKDVPKKSLYRADVHAARLMLSRMYLYMCNYEKAMEYASLVTTDGPALANLNGFTGTQFLTPDLPELIFSTGAMAFTGNIAVDNVYIVMVQGNDFQVSEELYEAYDPQHSHDLRLQYYIVYKDGFYCYKKLTDDYLGTPDFFCEHRKLI